MEREVRYCTTEDGVRIAYSVEGDGPRGDAALKGFEDPVRLYEVGWRQ